MNLKTQQEKLSKGKHRKKTRIYNFRKDNSISTRQLHIQNIRDMIEGCNRKKEIKPICLREDMSMGSRPKWKVKIKLLNKLQCFTLISAKNLSLHFILYFAFYFLCRCLSSYYAKAFDCVDCRNCGKFFKRWEYQTT